jgi:peptidoglycan/LPS O-acetylase OafA/YrhL
MGYECANNAWFDISMFFSLSGFLITKTTVESYERNGSVKVVQFWAKRVSRLFPVLLLTINAIALSQKLPWRNGHDDGIRFQREGVDLTYATLFATNYNLVYNQVDDYFDETSAPSITRHMWTLSIEEQYYIIWPVIIFLLVTLLKDKGADSKRHVWAILTLDLFVIAFSFVSSFATIEKMGVSAAYFSTWCRMGDIALGGAFYSISRLNPWVAMRLEGRNKDSNFDIVPPMTLGQKIACEILSQLSLLILVGVPMLQTSIDEMLPLYFYGLRFATSIPSMSIIAVALMQSDGGRLPGWAVATKVYSSPTLGFMGNISYGTYLFHWPLIVYFGDPNGMHRKAGVEVGGALDYHLRDFLIATSAFVMGTFSFHFFEIPAMKMSRKTKPPVTVATGFCAIGLTLATIWFVTHDLEPMTTYENDVDKFFGDHDGVADTPPSNTLPSSCTQCTDNVDPKMAEKLQLCLSHFSEKKCRKPLYAENQFCQQTCWENGYGYDGVECCPRQDFSRQDDSGEKWNAIAITMMGESISERIGVLFVSILFDL